MPVFLNQSAAQSALSVYSPKFFDAALSGSGTDKGGLLTSSLDPSHTPESTDPYLFEDVKAHVHKTTEQSDLRLIPVYAMPLDMLQKVKPIASPDANECFTLARSADKSREVYVNADLYSLKIEKFPSACRGMPAPRYFEVVWQVNFWFKSINKPLEVTRVLSANVLSTVLENADTWCENGYIIDAPEIDAFVDSLSVYEALCSASEMWQTSIDKPIIRAIESAASEPYQTGRWARMSELRDEFRYLENYRIPLEAYRRIFTAMTRLLNKDEIDCLCRQNMNLLLSNELADLQKNSASLPLVCAPAGGVPIDPMFSLDQAAAISSPGPLDLTAAGAGSGKSTVILARVDYMQQCGVKPEDILVLSFTNAAADHIKEKNPEVKSMTICSMIHSIYSLNYPDHVLSSLITICNSLEIYFENDPLCDEFKRCLYHINMNWCGAYADLNGFVENHFDDVIRMLDGIQQTSLELEEIICYQRISQMKEPAEIQSRHLIIDEVQDNSIFQFIYALRHVSLHHQSLFIVGDGAQTLYEFRNANPRALNVLESAGIFEPHKLQINYRSNQEILDFANAILRDIEANRFARIQLQANSMDIVTGASFRQNVQLHFEQVKMQKEVDQMAANLVATRMKPWLDDKLAKGEQVAFLAPFGRTIKNYLIPIIQRLYPGAKIANLVPEKTKTQTILSTYIRKYWSHTSTFGLSDLPHQIVTDICKNIDQLTKRKVSRPAVMDFVHTWAASADGLWKRWVAQYFHHELSEEELYDKLRRQMIAFEINNNAIRQTLASEESASRKENDDLRKANFIFSTIHSAKGLEFDNVAVICLTDTCMDEANKRMYYVAFTRAMKSEYVLAFGTEHSPLLQTQYEQLCLDFDKEDDARIGFQTNGYSFPVCR